jgi:hypothetical protein
LRSFCSLEIKKSLSPARKMKREMTTTQAPELSSSRIALLLCADKLLGAIKPGAPSILRSLQSEWDAKLKEQSR